MTTPSVRIFEVGGCVRDSLLGVPSKDIDFTVEAPSFSAMKEWLIERGFTIFVENEEFLTVRARFPRGEAIAMGGQTADFVMARKDGAYTDGRRPDEVIPGTLYDDLARRDFTMNAIARTGDGLLIDPHGGQADLRAGVIRAVGKAHERINEDALRGLRAIRFAVTKGFTIDRDIMAVIKSRHFAPLLESVSQEWVREEMFKAFRHDTLATMEILYGLPEVAKVFFSNGLWLKPTMED